MGVISNVVQSIQISVIMCNVILGINVHGMLYISKDWDTMVVPTVLLYLRHCAYS